MIQQFITNRLKQVRMKSQLLNYQSHSLWFQDNLSILCILAENTSKTHVINRIYSHDQGHFKFTKNQQNKRIQINKRMKQPMTQWNYMLIYKNTTKEKQIQSICKFLRLNRWSGVLKYVSAHFYLFTPPQQYIHRIKPLNLMSDWK